MFWQKQKDEFWRDVTGLGSSGLYFLLIIFFFLAKQPLLARKLIVGYALTYLISGVIKLTFFKNRPHRESYHTSLEKIDASAFPSVHSARAIFIALALSTTVPSAHVFFITIALLVCYSRIPVHKHDWKDVIGGILLGTATFWAITTLF